MAENDDNNINTTGADKEQRKADKQTKQQNTNQAQDAEKTQKRVKFIMKLITKYPIIIQIVIAILIFLFCWGVIGFFITLPGTYIENIKEFSQTMWGEIVGYFSGDNVTPSVTEEDQIALAQRLQDMGYDVVGYGFADASYEYDDRQDAETLDGFTNGTITGIATLSDNRNYLQAYIAQSEATYVLADWSVLGAIRSGGVLGVLDWLLGTEIVPDSEVQAFSEGMINITGITREQEGAWAETPTEFQEQMGMLGIDISVDRENKLMRLTTSRDGIASSPLAPRTTYYFDMSNWTSLYGKPLELFLSLHIGTMMPDLAYEFATSGAFNTKVNIDLQEVQSTFKVIYRTADGTEISQEDIERIYLRVMCNMTDEQINRFADAGKLDEAFALIANSIVDTAREDYINAQEGSEITTPYDITQISQRRGFNLSQIEETILGQKYSEVNVTETTYIIGYGPQQEEILIPSTTNITIDRWLAVVDLDNSAEVSNAQSAINNTALAGISTEQLENLKDLIEEGSTEASTYLPRIESVTKHWYYNDIEYEYGTAGRAKKKVQYTTEDENSPLSESNLNGASIILDTTYTNATGVFYQLAEPLVSGPNEAIKTLFKGGTVTVDGETYNFPGTYYRYDGTRLTAQKIANAKAFDEGKSTYIFQNTEYRVENPTTNTEMGINKQEVTFATEDADGNKSYNDAYAAFAILENVHSLESETVYRLLKELVIELQYFSREDFMKPLTQVLLWPVERVGSDTEEGDEAVDDVTAGIYREVNQYGLFLRNGVAVNSGDTIIAPGDATVVSVDGNTITLKFKSISDGNAQALQTKFGTDYFDVDRDIVLDMEMTITGVNASVSAGQEVTAGSTIGTATGDDMRIIMYNIDKSIVEDIETYMYPTYKGTSEGIFETIGQGE